VQARDLTWPEAMESVVAGARVTRRAWTNPAIAVYRADGFLMIRVADGQQHTLTVSDGDLDATDWYVVRPN
jgi:hypothetical protein